MSSFGADLKREREAKGITLKEISDRTKIGVRLLKALEEEQLEQLPGGIFDKSFLRQYARFLGLDEERLIGEYLKVTGASVEPGVHGTSATPEQKGGSYRTAGGGITSESPNSSVGSSTKSFLGDPVLRSSTEEYGLRSGNGRLVLIVLCIAAVIGASAYGVYWYFGQRANARAARSEALSAAKVPAPPTPAAQAYDAQPVPETAAPAADGVPSSGMQAGTGVAGSSSSVPSGTGTPAAGTGSVTPAATPPGGPAPKPNLGDTNPLLPAARSLLPSAQAVSEPPRTDSMAGQGGASTALTVQIDARKECWVSIAADGQKQWQGIMRAAATRRVEARGSVTLTLGDAGAVALTLNGKPLTFAGRSGEVKTLSITSNGVTQPTH